MASMNKGLNGESKAGEEPDRVLERNPPAFVVGIGSIKRKAALRPIITIRGGIRGNSGRTEGTSVDCF